MYPVHRIVRTLILFSTLSASLSAHTLFPGNACGAVPPRPVLTDEWPADSTDIDSTDIRYIFSHIPDPSLRLLSLRTSPDLWKDYVPADSIAEEFADTISGDSLSDEAYFLILENDFGEECELTISSDEELRVKLTPISTWTMRGFPTANGKLFIRIHTIHAAGAGSRIKAYRTDLTEDNTFTVPRPRPEEFLATDTVSSAKEKDRMAKSLHTSPIYFAFSKDAEGQTRLTATLGTEGLSKENIELIRPLLHPIHFSWDGARFRKQPHTTARP